MTVHKVGILGYGHLGQYLIEQIEKTSGYEISFVWNRSSDKIPNHLPILKDEPRNYWKYFPETTVIMEVAHPQVTRDNVEEILKRCDFVCGSPTVFWDMNIDAILGLDKMNEINNENEESEESEKNQQNSNQKHGLYIPVGAMWGANDIQKMHKLGTLKRVEVTMKKHPKSLKVSGDILKKMEDYFGDYSEIKGECELYSGSVRELCPLAPNNVNTMACAALAGLGFLKTEARLVADDRLDAHIIDIHVEGENGFRVETSRINPAVTGAVTGQATYGSFFTSLLRAHSQGSGIHFV